MGSTGVPNHGQAAIAACAEFHRRSLEDREGFWREQAKLIDWHKPFAQVLDYSRPPFRTMVRRRRDQPVPQRGRPPPRGARRPGAR